MYGYLVCERENNNLSLDDCYKKIESKRFSFYYNPLPRFENDKLFYEDDEKIVILDGVIFNTDELKKRYQMNSWKEAFNALYDKNKESFMDALRGSFSGVVYNKLTDSLEAFTNHSGEHTIYYSIVDGKIRLFSHIGVLKEFYGDSVMTLKPNVRGCRELMIAGFLFQDNTPFQSVKRLTAGKKIHYENSENYAVCYYHKFTNVPEVDMTLEQCIDKADMLFRQAVDRAFKKNQEYNYKAECDLSGGLDSRLVMFVATELGFKDILNICYCVKGNLDHTISKKIASDLRAEYFFLPMDENILKGVDEKVSLVGGQIDYILFTGAVDALKRADISNVGLTCMGLVGETVKGEWIRGDKHLKPEYCQNNRTSVIELDIPEEYKKDYDNYEQMNFYERGLGMIMSSAIARQQVCEAYSPFLDPDFLDFAFKIPVKYRKNCQFEKEWMVRKYPKAAEYVWQRTGKPLNVSTEKDQDNGRKSLMQLVIRAFNKVLRSCKIPYQVIGRFEMNPTEKWYENSAEVRLYLKEYFDKNIDLVDDAELRGDVERLWNSGMPYARIVAVNLLGVIKNFIVKRKDNVI